MPKVVKVSPRRKIKLTEKDIADVQKMVNDNPDTYQIELKLNAIIDYRTINNALQRGWMEYRAYAPLRKYLDQLAQIA